MAKIWLISDTHFGHTNVIKYCNRPFESSDEMDKTIIKNWNNTIKKYDKVFLLGDVVDDSYNEMNLKTIYKNYPNKETYSTKEVIQMILEELINDNSLSVRWISSIKDLDIERDLSRVTSSFDYDIINRMLDKVVLYRVTERK